jgi:hypothetical protein
MAKLGMTRKAPSRLHGNNSMTESPLHTEVYLRWSRFVGQLGGLFKVYSDV